MPPAKLYAQYIYFYSLFPTSWSYIKLELMVINVVKLEYNPKKNMTHRLKAKM
jgi:hypothetical protein